MSYMALQNIHTAMALLTTHTKKPDKDDQGKLKHVLKYLKGMRKSKIT